MLNWIYCSIVLNAYLLFLLLQLAYSYVSLVSTSWLRPHTIVQGRHCKSLLESWWRVTVQFVFSISNLVSVLCCCRIMWEHRRNKVKKGEHFNKRREIAPPNVNWVQIRMTCPRQANLSKHFVKALSANHGCVETLGSVFYFILWHFCAYALVRFSHRNYLIRFRKTLCFGVKYLFLSPQTRTTKNPKKKKGSLCS